MIENIVMYKGWLIKEVLSNNITGRWTAVKFGVEMCAGSISAIGRMIDFKEANL